MTRFAITFRGYDRAEVDAFAARADEDLASGDPDRLARARADAQAVAFRSALRGYDRVAVDQYLRRVARGHPDDRH